MKAPDENKAMPRILELKADEALAIGLPPVTLADGAVVKLPLVLLAPDDAAYIEATPYFFTQCPGSNAVVNDGQVWFRATELERMAQTPRTAHYVRQLVAAARSHVIPLDGAAA